MARTYDENGNTKEPDNIHELMYKMYSDGMMPATPWHQFKRIHHHCGNLELVWTILRMQMMKIGGIPMNACTVRLVNFEVLR